jgi:hypothetical protein
MHTVEATGLNTAMQLQNVQRLRSQHLLRPVARRTNNRVRARTATAAAAPAAAATAAARAAAAGRGTPARRKKVPVPEHFGACEHTTTCSKGELRPRTAQRAEQDEPMRAAVCSESATLSSTSDLIRSCPKKLFCEFVRAQYSSQRRAQSEFGRSAGSHTLTFFLFSPVCSSILSTASTDHRSQNHCPRALHAIAAKLTSKQQVKQRIEVAQRSGLEHGIGFAILHRNWEMITLSVCDGVTRKP